MALRSLLLWVLTAGLCLTGRAGYLRLKSQLAAVLIERAWNRSVQGDGWPLPPWPSADTYPVARLRIPRLHYDHLVLENASAKTLAFGPARLSSSARFGEPGNLAIAGHRDTWFKSLEGIANGDTIELAWFDPRRHVLRQRAYKVTAIEVVLPDQLELLAPTPDDALTLLTCYPFSRSPLSPERFLVRALPVSALGH
jgi:sortase A